MHGDLLSTLNIEYILLGTLVQCGPNITSHATTSQQILPCLVPKTRQQRNISKSNTTEFGLWITRGACKRRMAIVWWKPVDDNTYNLWNAVAGKKLPNVFVITSNWRVCWKRHHLFGYVWIAFMLNACSRASWCLLSCECYDWLLYCLFSVWIRFCGRLIDCYYWPIGYSSTAIFFLFTNSAWWF